MNSVQTKYNDFENLKMREFIPGRRGHFATQLMWMYRTVKKIPDPTILELGTHKGVSTTVFLQACEEQDGQLVSIDIHDHSDISDSSKWQFVQSDSTNIEYILSQAPKLNSGIDVLFIDSLHKKDHVEKELTTWYPLLTKHSHIFFDDIDANPYRKGNSKDNLYNEIDWNEIREYIESFFYANEHELYLDMMFGSTGMAHLYKLSPKGSECNKAVPLIHRKKTLRYHAHNAKKNIRSTLSGLKHKILGLIS